MASVSMQDVSPDNDAVKVIHTRHYEIYSTIQDRPDLLNRLGIDPNA